MRLYNNSVIMLIHRLLTSTFLKGWWCTGCLWWSLAKEECAFRMEWFVYIHVVRIMCTCMYSVYDRWKIEYILCNDVYVGGGCERLWEVHSSSAIL